jgi:DNA-binding transcriptional MerR regulator
MSYVLVRIPPPAATAKGPDGRRLDLHAFARAAGLHPDLVRRFVALGLLEPDRDAAGALWFSPAQLAAVARLQRLRVGFALNYAALGLVTDLLDRVAELESALRRQRRTTLRGSGGPSWT